MKDKKQRPRKTPSARVPRVPRDARLRSSETKALAHLELGQLPEAVTLASQAPQDLAERGPESTPESPSRRVAESESESESESDSDGLGLGMFSGFVSDRKRQGSSVYFTAAQFGVVFSSFFLFFPPARLMHVCKHGQVLQAPASYKYPAVDEWSIWRPSPLENRQNRYASQNRTFLSYES